VLKEYVKNIDGHRDTERRKNQRDIKETKPKNKKIVKKCYPDDVISKKV